MINHKRVSMPTSFEQTLSNGLEMLQNKQNFFHDVEIGKGFLAALLAIYPKAEARLAFIKQIPELEALGSTATGHLKGVFNCINSLSADKLTPISSALSGHLEAIWFNVSPSATPHNVDQVTELVAIISPQVPPSTLSPATLNILLADLIQRSQSFLQGSSSSYTPL